MMRVFLAVGSIWFLFTCCGDVPATAAFSVPFLGTFDRSNCVAGPVIHYGSNKMCLSMARTKAAGDPMTTSWFPQKIDEDDIFAMNDETWELEEKSLELLSTLIQRRLDPEQNPRQESKNHKSLRLVKGRFMDLTCTKEGEDILESLFDDMDVAQEEDEDVIRGAVMALQNLVILGTQVGVKGTLKQRENMVAHLWRRDDDSSYNSNYCDGDYLDVWDSDRVRRLKYRIDDSAAGTQLLARLNRKRSPQGAFTLLVQLGAWEKHEDLALLKSGFPIRFSEEEEEAAREAASTTQDPDALLGLRQDLRQHKVYTIDTAVASEIDDGLSVEVLTNEDGSTRQRFWIHIADADQWAPRGSKLFEVAQKRATSLYLPSRTLPMFPNSITDLMSLEPGKDLYALSLGVELLPDGSIDTSSIIITPSLIKISYQLSYEEVDEMLEEGVGYSEEWQLGALLAAATKRRQHRIENGATEGMVPNPIPQTSVTAFPDEDAPDGIGISITLEETHNSGKNLTEAAGGDGAGSSAESYLTPASPAFLLVAEMMILSGEAIGKWKTKCDEEDKSFNGSQNGLENKLRLPFRSQTPPDFKSMQQEVRILTDLLEGGQGGGYCHAWYARRFFNPVRVTEIAKSHFGLGLDCYIQWTSPIRRFGDLQVHGSVKRYLRRKQVNELMEKGEPIPPELSENQLWCKVPVAVESSVDEDGRITEYVFDERSIDDDIKLTEGMGHVKAARFLQRKSKEYWVFEHLDRLLRNSPEDAVFDAVVLGCTDPTRFQYAVYVLELGLEHRYLSEVGELGVGTSIKLKVASVYPRTGLLFFTIAPQ